VNFTDTQKLEAVRRELRWRKKVFPNRVVTGRMTPAEADYQIKVMEEIAADYECAAIKERLL
jgi:hypothetical protein